MYYNKILNKQTPHRFRIKTEEEFLTEFGTNWMSNIRYGWNNDGRMDFLFGVNIEQNISEDDFLDEDFFINITDNQDGYTWMISRDMIKENSKYGYDLLYSKRNLIYD